MVTPLQIQDAVEQHITGSIAAINRTSSGGSDRRPAVAAQYWVAYEGSSYVTPPDLGYGEGFTQDRLLSFASYVEVLDLQQDYREAMTIHESLIALISGFFPQLEGIKKPFIAIDDAPIAVRTDRGTVYRYRARYQVLVDHVSTSNPDPLQITSIVFGLFRSPAGEVGEPPPIATKDADLIIT